jgi:hypothetical protein
MTRFSQKLIRPPPRLSGVLTRQVVDIGLIGTTINSTTHVLIPVSKEISRVMRKDGGKNTRHGCETLARIYFEETQYITNA